MDPTRFDPGPLADIELDTGGQRPTLVFVRELRHSPETVWAALTDPNLLGEWAPYTADRDLGSAGDVTILMTDGEVTEEFPATVTRAEPPKLLEYTWGDDRLRWQLDATDTGTRLTLEHTVQGPDWVPKVAAGWHICLVVAEHLLDGDPIGPIVGERARDYGWQRLHDDYATELGIAGTGWPEGSAG